MLTAQGGVPDLLAGRYAVERMLGEGATATVHLARDTHAGISVAVKVLRPELAETGAARRFLKEIRRTASLEHPRILKVLDSGEHDGRPFFVLPYMEGGTLRRRLKKEPQLALDEAIAITRSIAEALDHAHARGLVHRDVKPENILFTGGVACLGDFGIALALQAVYGDASSSAHVIRGTPAYMSPEQAAGEQNLDGKSDQYSLACVFYEMVTGMPAFMGPTPESVIAQRFAHGPRQLNVYRPSASPGMQAAIDRGLAYLPADRFGNAMDMVEALASSIDDVNPSRRGGAQGTDHAPKGSRLLRVVTSAAAIGVAAVLTIWRPFTAGSPSTVAGLDTTRIAILPFEHRGVEPLWRGEDLLAEGLTRWSGISVVDRFQVADALQRHGRMASNEDAQAVAALVGAGRFVRGLIADDGYNRRATISLFDAVSGEPLHQESGALETGLEGELRAFGTFADSILLRGSDGSAPPASSRHSQVLPAVLSFARALRALDDWDLAGADSGFRQATDSDPAFSRAYLWLAQVRAWQGLPRSQWGAIAELGAHAGGLTEREQRLGAALIHLARGEFSEACAAYDDLRRRQDRDFAAWFGMGQCRSMNRLVLPDSASPSGWRFEADAHVAMESFERAFEILPSVHRGYERGAFGSLRVLLLASARTVTGFAADSARFLAWPSWQHDRLVLVPYPWQRMIREAVYPPGFEEALRQRQNAFRRIASGWAAAYPSSSGAKEALALALDLVMDPAALDTLRRARSLARPDRARLMASREVLLLVKYGLDNESALREARHLADSLLALPTTGDPELARALLPLTALVADCGRGAALIREAGRPMGAFAFSEEQYIAAEEALLQSVTGCALPNFRALLATVDGAPAGGRRAERALRDAQLLLRPAVFAERPDGGVLERLTVTAPHPILRATERMRAGDSAAVRRALAESGAGDDTDPPTPDFALMRAALHAQLGDTAAAVLLLDQVLENLRRHDTEIFTDLGVAGAVVRAASLRATIASRQGQAEVARRWAVVPRELRAGKERVVR